jgi:transcription elongation factor/antiterminator RfaH
MNEGGQPRSPVETLQSDPKKPDKAEASSPHSDLANDLALAGNERWFLVHTLPQKEMRAALHLGAQGFRTFLPQHMKTVRHARQLRTIRAPLFPRYLFIILNLGRDRWLSVRSTVGVSSLVGYDDRPTPVPVGIAEALILQRDNINLSLFGDDLLQAGQRVRIASGPFTDFIGTLDRVDETGRVRLLLEMMGSAIAISLPRTGILPAA